MATTSRTTPTRVQTTTVSGPTTSYQACTWLGHCLGASCSTDNDCDQDWVCASKICSPCCGNSSAASNTTVTTTISSSLLPGSISSVTANATTLVTSTAASVAASVATTVAAPATTAAASKPHTLNTVAAIGVGLAIVALLIAGIGIGFWLWRARRGKQRRSWALVNSTGNRSQTDTVGSYGENETKGLVAAQRHELANNTKPTEIASVELVELEGDGARWGQSTKPSQPPSTSNSIARSRENVQMPQIPHMPQVAIPEPTGRRPSYRFEEYAVSPNSASPGNIRFSPISDVAPSHHPNSQQFERRHSYQDEGHSPLEHDALVPAGGAASEPYTLFRWPDGRESGPFR